MSCALDERGRAWLATHSLQQSSAQTDVVMLQGAINIDRFYNLLPFVNRMPRNQFYASLSSKVAGRCIDSSRRSGKAAQTATAGELQEPCILHAE